MDTNIRRIWRFSRGNLEKDVLQAKMDSKTRRIWRYSKGTLEKEEKDPRHPRTLKRKSLPNVPPPNPKTPAKLVVSNKSESSLKGIPGNEITFKEKIGSFLQKFRTDLSMIAKSPNQKTNQEKNEKNLSLIAKSPIQKTKQEKNKSVTAKQASNSNTPAQTSKRKRPFKTKVSCTNSSVKTPVRKYKANPFSRSLDRVRLENLSASSKSLPSKSKRWSQEAGSSPSFAWKQKLSGNRSLPRIKKRTNNNYLDQGCVEGNAKSPQRYKTPGQKLMSISAKVGNKAVIPMETLSDALALIVATGIYAGVKSLYEKIFHLEEAGMDSLQNLSVDDMMQLGEAGEHATRFLLAEMASQHLKSVVHDSVLVICDNLQDIQ